MTYQRTASGFIIRIHANEKLIQTLTEFAEQQNVRGAFFFGIGAVKEADIGMYHMDTYEYTFTTYDSPHEITHVAGNITQTDGKYKVHAHGTLAGPDGKAIGGHIKEAVIEPTCEITLFTSSEQLKRSHDSHSKLDLLDLPEKY